MEMEIVADSSSLKEKNEDQKSILLLIWKGNKYFAEKNGWAMLENLNGSDAPKISDCGGNSLDLPEERLVRPHTLQLGSHLYCIGGTTSERNCDDRFKSSKVFQFDLNQPSKGWTVCYYLPFFCGKIQTAVSGDLIYIFPFEDHFYPRATDYEPPYSKKYWAYIFNTKDMIKSRFISSPIPYCVAVIVCASLDDVAGVDRGVMVYLPMRHSGVAWFHDPVHNSWKTHNGLFGFKPPDTVLPPKFVPSFYNYAVSNGIIYIFRVGRDFNKLGELVLTPLLCAYDIGKGKLLFRDLSFKGPHKKSGTQAFNFLIAVGDCKLCWFEFFSAKEVLSYTVISISYGADDPFLSVDKSGMLDDFQFYLLPSCLAIDSFCLDRIKRLSRQVVQKKSSESSHFKPFSNPDSHSPQPSILMLIWRVKENKLESVWAMIRYLDRTFSPDMVEYDPSSLALPEGSESEECLALHPPYTLLVGSHVYCIGGVVDWESKKHFLSDKVLRYDILSAGWKVFYCLPFFCKDILTAVSGDFIYFFPHGTRRLDTNFHDWAYMFDTKECKGRFLCCPLPTRVVPVTVCASVDDVAGLGPGVIVYLCYDVVEEAWFHDPVNNSWELFSRFIGLFYLKPFVPPGNIATTASKGILYTLRFRKRVRQPLLTAFNIVNEKQLFRGLKVNGPDSSSGWGLFNYLFAIADRKLCWLEYFSAGVIQYTIISVSYNPVPSLKVDKSGVFHGFQFGSYPSCLACDSLCLDPSLPVFTDVGRVVRRTERAHEEAAEAYETRIFW